ncbi:MAG: GDSL-type esterase/lipase family protein [Clostridia bacterium]|nr:GDSL-type esterase/lipase family protein [Clostridia bacterium]
MRLIKFYVIIFCLFTAATFAAVISSEYVDDFAEKASENRIVYTSLGDSISAGYALPDYKEDGTEVAESFVSKFGKEIKATVVNNLAVSGAKTEDLLTLLDLPETEQVIKNSDVITISIGSNDCLSPGLNILYNSVKAKDQNEIMKKIGAIKDDKIQLLSYIGILANSIDQTEAQKELQNGVENFKKNFTKIIDKIKLQNKSCLIIVESFYNPYKDFVYEKNGVKLIAFGEAVQKYIDEMNGFLVSHKYCNKKYCVADISAIETAKTNVLIDVDNAVFSIDPHPNLQGHNFIFGKTLEAYNKQKCNK